jgi:L-ribulose-5-phosphate 3-epimerase
MRMPLGRAPSNRIETLAFTPSISLDDLPGAAGIAFQGRQHPKDAYDSSLACGLSHYYVDTVFGTLDDALIDLLSTDPERSPRPIVHGDYRQAIASPDPSLRKIARERILREMVAASRMRAPLIVHGTSDPALNERFPDHEASLALFDAELFELEQVAEILDVELWLENLPRNESVVFSTLRDYERILRRHPSLRMVFDVGHSNIQNDAPLSPLREFPDQIVALSLSDNHGDIDSHLPLGEGAIRFDLLLDEVAATGWRGLYVFETLGANVAAGVERLRSFQRQAR